MVGEATLALGPATRHPSEDWDLIFPDQSPHFRDTLQLLYYEIFPEMHRLGGTDSVIHVLGPQPLG